MVVGGHQDTWANGGAPRDVDEDRAEVGVDQAKLRGHVLRDDYRLPRHHQRGDHAQEPRPLQR